ncbi:MAG: VTT domain-containing protein [Planctomycetes bacterium]|nr:VTT domain-containing protein [Planctomycetota bacterium]
MDWETVKQYVVEYGYLAVGVGTFVDQSGLQAFVVAGAVLSQLEPDFSIYGVILAGAGGSLASDLLLWGIGRWRAGWLERIVRSDKGRMRLKVLEDGMHRFAFPLLAFGRLLPWIGRFVPAAAGLRRVPFLRVLLFSALGALVSSAGYAMLGYFAAESVRILEEYAGFIWVGALLVSVPITSLLLRRFDRIVKRRLDDEAKSQNDD